jgi:hypothetical protein
MFFLKVHPDINKINLMLAETFAEFIKKADGELFENRHCNRSEKPWPMRIVLFLDVL